MIVVRIDKWPDGDPNRATNLGVIAIANRGLADKDDPGEGSWGDASDLFDYEVMYQPQKGRRRRGWTSHYRRRGILKLVEKALEAVSG